MFENDKKNLSTDFKNIKNVSTKPEPYNSQKMLISLKSFQFLKSNFEFCLLNVNKIQKSNFKAQNSQSQASFVVSFNNVYDSLGL